MQYLTYEEYLDIGGTLEETAFNRNIDRACGFIDIHTFNRLQNVLAVSRSVKACVRDLVEHLANNSKAAVTSKSQSAGGVSESESYATKTNDDFNAEMLDIVCDYLLPEKDECGTPLMYRGAMQ